MSRSILDPSLNLTLRPMKHPRFYEMYKDGIRNTWNVDEVDFAIDVEHLHGKLSIQEKHIVHRLVAFFATGDSIVSNNLVLSLYTHINSPEARMFLSRQLFEEAVHVQFYLTLLDTYIPDHEERAAAFSAIETIPSIARKATFCFAHMSGIDSLDLTKKADRRRFLINLLCFAACVEGLFFFASFAYVYFLRSRGLLHGLASGTNWVFRDESCHMAFAFEVVRSIREEEPDLFDESTQQLFVTMMEDAVDCETQFAEDLLGQGIAGLSVRDMRGYLEFIADQRLAAVGMSPRWGTKNPLPFMDLQDMQELTNFFERRVSAYQTGGDWRNDLVRLHGDF